MEPDNSLKSKTDIKIKRQTNLDRHGPRPIAKVCHLPVHPLFLLQTTFKDWVLRTGTLNNRLELSIDRLTFFRGLFSNGERGGDATPDISCSPIMGEASHQHHQANHSDQVSVVDPHHIVADLDADPDSTYHPDAGPDSDPNADPESDILFDADADADADPDPTFHPDADPDPGPYHIFILPYFMN